MEAGRPVLVVPPEANYLDARHVVVAWKDTREARRALTDSLPVLKMATDATVVEIAEHADMNAAPRSGERSSSGSADLRRTLATLLTL